MNMLTVGIIGLVIGTSYYLSRRSNRKATERLRSLAPSDRSGSPAEVARFELMRAEHALRARGAQTDNGTGPIG